LSNYTKDYRDIPDRYYSTFFVICGIRLGNNSYLAKFQFITKLDLLGKMIEKSG